MLTKHWKLVMAACLAAGACAATAQSADACCLFGGCGLFSAFRPTYCAQRPVCAPQCCPSPCGANYAAPACGSCGSCNSGCTSCSGGAAGFASQGFSGTPTFSPSPCGPGGCSTYNRPVYGPTSVTAMYRPMPLAPRRNASVTPNPYSAQRATSLKSNFFGDYRTVAPPTAVRVQRPINTSWLPPMPTATVPTTRVSHVTTVKVQTATLTRSVAAKTAINDGWETVTP